MKEYDYIAVGSGSALPVVTAIRQSHPNARIAVIDKDDPGGICLNRGCIPSKLLLYPAELVRTVQRAGEFGIQSSITSIDFPAVMQRMRTIIKNDSDAIQAELSNMPHLDYYHAVAEFVAPYTLKVADQTLKSKRIFLCTGSKPTLPPVKNLDKVPYLTSDTILNLDHLPESVAIIGGGYIAAEYGHFLSSMGSRVTILGRNPRFIPEEEPEISALALRDLGKHLTILTNHDVQQAETGPDKKIRIHALNRTTKKEVTVTADAVLVASGRGPNTDILHPELSGIKTDKNGWIITNEYLETSQPGIWAFGDANGKFMFKHVANFEAKIVYANAVLKQKMPVDYRVIPHAVFSDPEIASVGLLEEEAKQKFGAENLLIGFARYEDTAKGVAMGVKDYFVKVIVEEKTMNLLGVHIIGPYASVLIQEFVTVLSSAEPTVTTITGTMHIHPALTEVVQQACGNLMTPEEYHRLIAEQHGENQRN
ncbi:MAG: dihydrolipoyl dehydrogenase [Methanomicrobiales archaeon HGW-Methanomicrobiales-1]|jgi:dihydrolipoamide dehydrogenase|nr:MAG: dihydrolipoyl dehydrogenase [Methanomicrobiales archaeon HGW-Methanomicrobiales-1]